MFCLCLYCLFMYVKIISGSHEKPEYIMKQAYKELISSPGCTLTAPEVALTWPAAALTGWYWTVYSISCQPLLVYVQ